MRQPSKHSGLFAQKIIRLLSVIYMLVSCVTAVALQAVIFG